MIKLISDRPTCDLPRCRSVIFFPAGVLPAGKKMTLWQHGKSRVVYRLCTNVGISRLPWKSGNTDICAESKHITQACFVSPISLTSTLTDTLQMHRMRMTTKLCARLCPYIYLFNLAWTHRT